MQRSGRPFDALETNRNNMARKNNAKKVAAGVYRLPDGRLRIRIYAPNQLERTLESGTTIAQAAAERKRWKAEIASPAEAEDVRNVRTVACYSLSWMKGRAARRSTLRTDASVLENHTLPWIGHIPVDELTRSDVQQMLAEWPKERKQNGALYSRHSINTWWRITRNLLRDLAADEGIPDPTNRVRLRVDDTDRDDGKREDRTLSAEELGALLEAVQVHYPDRHVEAMCLAFGGMRPGELYALRWQDVDAPRRTLRIRRSVAASEVNGTKTGTPRDVVVPQVLLDHLEEHRREMIREQHPGLSRGLVFPPRRGMFRSKKALAVQLAECGRVAGVEAHVTPLVLRRTFNTLLVAAGVDRLVLRSQIGHTSEAMTAKYAGIRHEDKAAAAETLEAMVLDE